MRHECHVCKEGKTRHIYQGKKSPFTRKCEFNIILDLNYYFKIIKIYQYVSSTIRYYYQNM